MRCGADRRCCYRSVVEVALARFPFLELLLGLVLADAVGVLDLADQLVALAGDLVELIVGQLAPLLFHFALRLLPVACDAIPVHAIPLTLVGASVIPASRISKYRWMSAR